MVFIGFKMILFLAGSREEEVVMATIQKDLVISVLRNDMDILKIVFQ